MFDGSCCFFLFEHAPYHVVQDASMFEVRQFHICVKTNFHFEGATIIQLQNKQINYSTNQSINQPINQSIRQTNFLRKLKELDGFLVSQFGTLTSNVCPVFRFSETSMV